MFAEEHLLVSRNAAVDVRLLVRVDNYERHLNGGGWRRNQAAFLRLAVARHETLKGHLLQNQFAQLLLLGLDALLARLVLLLQIGALLCVKGVWRDVVI